MKKMIAAFVLAAAVASPVMAQEYIPSSVPNGEAAYPAATMGLNAFASASASHRGRTVHQASTVGNGAYVGTDPDANVRLQLQNEADSIDR